MLGQRRAHSAGARADVDDKTGDVMLGPRPLLDADGPSADPGGTRDRSCSRASDGPGGPVNT